MPSDLLVADADAGHGDGSLAPHTLVVGCGYCGRALSRRLSLLRETRMWGSRRSDAGEVAEAGAELLLWDLGVSGDWTLPDALRGAVVDVVYMVPPGRGDDPQAMMRSVLTWLDEGLQIRTLVYVGATSVYGNSQGGRVIASDRRQAVTARGKRRAEAEDLVLEMGLAMGARVCLARLPGIYGPGRTIEVRLEKGSYKLVEGGHKWTARVHRDDVAMGLEVLLRHGQAGAGYIVCDDEPFEVRALVEFVCERRGLPWPEEPTLEDYAISRGAFAASFWRTNNRYDNEAIRALPGFKLRYPSFREGYEALWRDEQRGKADGV